MRLRGAVAAAVAVTVLAGMAVAGPLEDGEAAYDRGDYAGAVRHWLPLAQQGNPRAENWLGVLYHNGQGVAQDDRTAVAWYRRAAERDDVVAQFNLAAEYVEGTGVPQDDAEAAKWFGRAASRGYPPAERELGTMYHEGRGGLERSAAEAVKWWRAAANAGDAGAAKALQGATAAEAAVQAESARRAAARKAELPAELGRNKAVNYWRLWKTGCFNYVAAESFFETGPRPRVPPRRNCCPGVLTIKGVQKDPDGVASGYLVEFAAKGGGYCPVQFFGGWVGPAVMASP